MSWFKSEDNNRLKELESTVNQLEQEKSKLLAEMANYKRTISTFVDVKAGYEEEVKTLKTSHKNEVIKLKTELENEKKSLNRKVNMTLAKVGVEQFAPEEIFSQNVNDTPAGIYSKFVALTGTEKGKFFKDNETKISQYLSSRK